MRTHEHYIQCDANAVRLWVWRCLVLFGLCAGALWSGAEEEPPLGGEKPPEVLAAEAATSEAGSESAENELPYVTEVVTARVVEAGAPGHRKVRSVRIFKEDAGRVDWSQQGDWLAFDKLESEFYQLYVMKPDGTREKCITCNLWDFRKTHSLSPAWHPSGEFIVFSHQENANKLNLDILGLTTPHRGLHSEIWVITPDGRQSFKLTQTRDRGAAVLDPYFSFEGSMLAWSQRVVSAGRWGEWEPHVARFQIKRGVPRISKVKNYQPQVQQGFVATHGFTPSDNGLLISAVPLSTRNPSGRDVMELDLESGSLEPLTSSPAQWDELATALPRSEGIVWVSDRGIERPSQRLLPRRNDVWYRSAGGHRQERLTFFNDPQSDHFLGEALIDDLAWNPDGDKLLLHVVSTDAAGSVKQAIYMVEFDSPL